MPRLVSAGSVAEVRLIVDDEFTHWFRVGAASSVRLDAAPAEIWDLWLASPLRAPQT